MPIIGLGARSAEYADLPLQWMPHIQVADVAASVESALDLGGTELMHGRDGDGKSQWAVLLDPNGAAFGVVPVVSAETIPPAEGTSSRGGSGAAYCAAWWGYSLNDYQQVAWMQTLSRCARNEIERGPPIDGSWTRSNRVVLSTAATK